MRAPHALVLALAAMQLHWTLCEEAAQTGTRPSWEEMQRLYPGIRREGPACDAPGQEGCPADSEALYRPRMYGTEDGLDRFSGGASGPAAEQPSGDGCGDGSAAEPETIRRPPRPSGDELYRAAVDEALAAAASKPLDHFRSGTSYMTTEADGPQFARTFVRRRKGWDHRMHLMAAMASDAVVTAQELLPLRPGRGVQPALVTGDAAGKLSLFRPTGELLAEFDSGGGEVTAVAALASRHNATTLISGHANGAVRTHIVELRAARPAEGNEAPNRSDEGADFRFEVAAVRAAHATLLPPEAPQRPDAAAAGECPADDSSTCTAATGGSSGSGAAQTADAAPEAAGAVAAGAAGVASSAAAGSHAAVRHIVTLRNGREWRFAAIQRGGGIAVWREDGRLLQWAHCPALVLAARWSEASITMLTPQGGAVLLTHAVPSAPQPVVRLKPCAGLGDDSGRALAASAFDVRQPVRAYGATRDGQLLWLSLGHAKTFQNCQVQHSVPLRAGPPATLQGGITLRALAQHIIVASTAWVSVFDVSRPATGPAHLFEDTVHVIMAALRMQAPMKAPPLVAAGRAGPVALGLGSGVVATYEPALLHFDHEPDFSFFEAWSRPLVSVAMLLVAALQVGRARRRARRRREAAAGGNSGGALLAGDAVPGVGLLERAESGSDMTFGPELGGGLEGSDSDGSEDISNYEVAQAMAAQDALHRQRRQ